MNIKNELSRMTIDVPKDFHRRLKAIAAVYGKSMREIIIESVESYEACLSSDHVPNKKTIKAIKEAQDGIGLKSASDLNDLIKKLGM